MSSAFFTASSAAIMQGNDAELAYANAFGGVISGGINDKGHDVKIDHPAVRSVQVKSSVPGMLDFFKESIRRRRFIPVCLGEPGSMGEMIDSITRFGAWVGKEVPHRQRLLEGAQQVRNLCRTA